MTIQMWKITRSERRVLGFVTQNIASAIINPIKNSKMPASNIMSCLLFGEGNPPELKSHVNVLFELYHKTFLLSRVIVILELIIPFLAPRLGRASNISNL